jgi:hypothetical protein
MNAKLLLAAAAAAGLLLMLVCISWSHHRPGDNRTGKHPTSRMATPPPPNPAPLPRPDLAAAGMGRLLPFPPDAITQAAETAANFTAAYGTHRYDEPPTEYLRRLEPMMSPIVERAATDPATLTQRQRTQEVSAGQAHAQRIRALGPTSVTFLVTATEHVTTAHADRHDTIRYALTLSRASRGWLVYGIDLAATGDSGDRSADGSDTSP